MKIYYSPKCLEYSQFGHPESPQRISAAHDLLEKNGFQFIEPQPCTERDILRVHSRDLLVNIKQGSFYDNDTPVLTQIFRHALLAAGSAIMASESALQGEMTFSLMRPPGHHATRNRVMGFCYFNNIAVAVAKHISENPKGKVAILDIDCHHGNGTEDIFFGDRSVLYVSLHQSPLYPGTGLESHENCINFPLSPGTTTKAYLKMLEKACRLIDDYKPTLMGISAGFDSYREDPLAQLQLDLDTYSEIGRIIAGLEKPTFMIMEGGYSKELPQCVYQFISGLESNPLKSGN